MTDEKTKARDAALARPIAGNGRETVEARHAHRASGMADMKIERGISQRALDALWLDYGGTIEFVGAEKRYVSLLGDRSHKYNATRKDATAKLVTFARPYLLSAHRASERRTNHAGPENHTP